MCSSDLGGQHFLQDRTKEAQLGGLAVLRQVLIVVRVGEDGVGFQVVGLEDLVATQATDVIDAVAAHQELCLFMLTAWHSGS